MNKKFLLILFFGSLFFCILYFSTVLACSPSLNDCPDGFSCATNNTCVLNCSGPGTYCPQCSTGGASCGVWSYLGWNPGSCFASYNGPYSAPFGKCCPDSSTIAGSQFGYQSCCDSASVSYVGQLQPDAMITPSSPASNWYSAGGAQVGMCCNNNYGSVYGTPGNQICCGDGSDFVDSHPNASCCGQIPCPTSGKYNGQNCTPGHYVSNVLTVNGQQQCGCNTNADCVPLANKAGNAEDPLLIADCSSNNADGGNDCIIGPFEIYIPGGEDQKTIHYSCVSAGYGEKKCVETDSECNIIGLNNKSFLNMKLADASFIKK